MRFEGGSPSGVNTRVLRALILLVFRSFRIRGWRDFEQPSSAIHAPACCKKSHSSGLDPAGVSVFSALRLPRFWIAIVGTPRSRLFFGLWSCWCFGLFGSEVDEILSSHRQLSTPPLVAKNRVLQALILLVFCFSALRLPRLWAAVVSTPRSCLCLYAFRRRQPFRCKHSRSSGLDPAGVSVFSDLWGWRDFEQPSSAIHAPACCKKSRSSGLDPAGVSVFSALRLPRLWAAVVSTPRSCLCLYAFRRRQPFRCKNSRSSGLDPAGVSVFSDLWGWRDFAQPSSALHAPALWCYAFWRC